jgi:hypothetical protein
MGLFLHTKKLFKRMFNPDGKNMNPHEEEIMDYLILNGGLEAAGIDSQTGELLYAFTPKIKEIMPDLYEDHISSVNTEVMGLWEKGYININFFEKDPIITLSEKALNKEEVDKLSPKDQWSLHEIKRILISPKEEL